jgi:hypothetical protein
MTSKEILEEYCKEMEIKYPFPELETVWINLIDRCREDEPRINSGIHLIDYIGESIGPDYPWN